MPGDDGTATGYTLLRAAPSGGVCDSIALASASIPAGATASGPAPLAPGAARRRRLRSPTVSGATGSESTDGLATADSSPVQITLDTTPPTVSITSQPASFTQSTTANFSFTVSDGTRQCQLDGGSFTSCTSPTTMNYSGARGDVSHVHGAVDRCGRKRRKRHLLVDGRPHEPGRDDLAGKPALQPLELRHRELRVLRQRGRAPVQARQRLVRGVLVVDDDELLGPRRDAAHLHGSLHRCEPATSGATPTRGRSTARRRPCRRTSRSWARRRGTPSRRSRSARPPTSTVRCPTGSTATVRSPGSRRRPARSPTSRSRSTARTTAPTTTRCARSTRPATRAPRPAASR